MNRTMAVDWGKRRVGVAVSDETRTLARSLETLEVMSTLDAVDQVVRLAGENDIDTLVVGDPIHMSGRRSEGGREVRRFVVLLEKRLPGMRFVLWDERLTSHEAAAILRERGERRKGRRKGRLDQVAAAVLLQSFLDSAE
jgi:putative Holliday junction resolvase